MAKLRLEPNPTFVAKVGIPVPGEDKRVQVRFTFAHMSKEQFEGFKPEDGETDAATLLRFVKGWHTDDVDEPFSEDALRKLCNAYPGAAYAISSGYAAELHGNARLGN